MKKNDNYMRSSIPHILISVLLILAFLIFNLENCNGQSFYRSDDVVKKTDELSSTKTVEFGLLIGGNTEVVKDTGSFDRYSTSGMSYRLSFTSRRVEENYLGLVYGGIIGFNRTHLNIPTRLSKSVSNYSFQSFIGVADEDIYAAIIFGAFIPDTRKHITVYNFGINSQFTTDVTSKLSMGINMELGFKTNNQFFNKGTDLYGIMSFVSIFTL